MHQDDDLLRRGRRVQDAALGQDLEPDGGRGGGVVLGPLGDPVVEEFVGLGVPRQPQPPLVGDLAQRLAEDQAGLGGHRVDPPAAGLAARGS